MDRQQPNISQYTELLGQDEIDARPTGEEIDLALRVAEMFDDDEGQASLELKDDDTGEIKLGITRRKTGLVEITDHTSEDSGARVWVGRTAKVWETVPSERPKTYEVAQTAGRVVAGRVLNVMQRSTPVQPGQPEALRQQPRRGSRLRDFMGRMGLM